VKRALLLFLVAGCGPEGSPVAWDEEGYTSQCPPNTLEGADVYAGDGTIDWNKYKASGRVFAFMKATQGDYNKQSTFTANWTNSKANGVIRSPYHFFDGTIDGVKQANAFLAEINAAGGMDDDDLPPMLDIECPTSSSQTAASANCEHTGDSGWVATATLSQRIFDWLDTVEAATGRKAIIYSYPSWFAGVGVTDMRLKDYPLFIATYAMCASVPAPWTDAVFWQYSATGSIPGIGAANADHDKFVGTNDDLSNFISASLGQARSDAGPPNVDLTPPPEDLSTAPPDLSHPFVKEPSPSPHPETVSSGCKCDVGGARDGSGAWMALLLILALTARRARNNRWWARRPRPARY
jgi:MYXO-CTERM domain-containing protein